MGIEPTSKAWEAFVLPLNYTRGDPSFYGCLSGLATRFTIVTRQRFGTREPPIPRQLRSVLHLNYKSKNILHAGDRGIGRAITNC
jgi:hypothetical protein